MLMGSHYYCIEYSSAFYVIFKLGPFLSMWMYKVYYSAKIAY